MPICVGGLCFCFWGRVNYGEGGGGEVGRGVEDRGTGQGGGSVGRVIRGMSRESGYFLLSMFVLGERTTTYHVQCPNIYARPAVDVHLALCSWGITCMGDLLHYPGSNC
jgi:hypothetical protein